MSDGIFNSSGAQEVILQKDFIRHRLLVVNTGAVVGVEDASGQANQSANSLAFTPPAGGPHFVMSQQTPDGRPTLGFEVAFWVNGLSALTQMVPAPGGFDVTVWVLLPTMQFPDGSIFPPWASFATLTGVQFLQLFHSFDINTSAVRFQIGPTGIVADGSVGIAFSEL